MLFSVYPEGPAPKRGANPLLIVLGICGGCVLLGVLATVALGFFSVRMGSKYLGAFEAQDTAATTFLTYLRDKKYDDAHRMMSPEAQQSFPVDTLTQLAQGAEKKLGKMQSWTQSEEAPDMQGGSSSKSMVIKHTYSVTYAKGKAVATFSFHSADPMNPGSVISDFDLQSDKSGTKEDSSEGSDSNGKNGQNGKDGQNGKSGENGKDGQ